MRDLQADPWPDWLAGLSSRAKNALGAYCHGDEMRFRKALALWGLSVLRRIPGAGRRTRAEIEAWVLAKESWLIPAPRGRLLPEELRNVSGLMSPDCQIWTDIEVYGVEDYCRRHGDRFPDPVKGAQELREILMMVGHPLTVGTAGE